MSKTKCIKTKNPCKICLRPVTQKNGLQCQGVCASWVHFNCIHYTPGKIKDIKAGLLKINCPCPDCKTDIGKEYYVSKGYTCEKTTCPAKMPPVCENVECVQNVKNCSVGIQRSEPVMCSANSSLSGKSLMESTAGDTARVCSSISNLQCEMDQVTMTVGQLTQQINKLMMKLQDTIKNQLAASQCTTSGPRDLCPKPCYCADKSSKKGKKKC